MSLTKEQIVASIEQRIKDEHRKHSHSIEEWPKIAALKIYATFDIKAKKESIQIDNRNQITIESLNKEYVFLDKVAHKDSVVSFCAGMRFKVTQIKNKYIKIKLVSTIEECKDAIEDFAAIQVKECKKTIATLDKIIKVWENDANRFEKDKNSPWNEKHGGHTINTSYPVPKNHPDKGDAYSEDAIKTYDYKHLDGKKNYYSYQSGKNEWYSKATYEFMRLAELRDLKKWEELSPATRKEIFKTYLSTGWLSKYEFNINTFNKNKFKLVK